MMGLHQLKQWLKTSDNDLARHLFVMLKLIRGFEVKAIPKTDSVLYNLHILLSNSLSSVMRVFYWTPLFKSRLSTPAKRLYLYGGMPFTSGPLEIALGSDCRVSGQTTFSGRSTSREKPQLIVGSNIDIGWQTTIAVGTKVVIEDNVRIAGRAFFAGYPGHPIDAERRAKGEPCDDEQSGDIIIKQDAWLATGVMVMAGVTIGKGTIVAAGSVVTKSLPDYVLAGGVPAVVIKSLNTKAPLADSVESRQAPHPVKADSQIRANTAAVEGGRLYPVIRKTKRR